MNLEKEIILKTLLETPLNEMFSEESSSSDGDFFSNSEETEEPQIRRKKVVRSSSFVENTVQKYSNVEFRIHFRLTKSTAYRLIDLLSTSGFIPRHIHGRSKITAEKAFLLSLWYFGNTETFRQISDRFNVTYSSAHYSLKRVIKFLLKIKQNIIKWPNVERAVVITTEFKKKQGISNVIGAIDGSHIEIPKPKNNQLDYVNRKGYHSLLIQAVVDHEKKFIDIFCGEPGSMHDSRLLRKSGLYNKIENNPTFMGDKFLIGDSAYPNLHWLVTPFKDNGYLTENQKIFNYKISATRVIVEMAFGFLKGRFRRLKKLDNIDIMLCSHIIMACCVLHNICIDNRDIFEEDITGDYNQPHLETCNWCVTVNSISRQQQVFNKLFN